VLLIDDLGSKGAVFEQDISDTEGDEIPGRVTQLSDLAWQAKSRGDLETALFYEKKAYQECLESGSELNPTAHKRLLAAKLYNLGQLYYQLGKAVEARAHFEQAAQIDKKTRNRVGEVASLRSLAVTYQDIGELEQALDLHLHALALTLDTDAGFEHGIAIDQANIGSVYIEMGEFEESLRYLREAHIQFEKMGAGQESA
jgi:tetratricopeptide (TPR) repeat protein